MGTNIGAEDWGVNFGALNFWVGAQYGFGGMYFFNGISVLLYI